ncbi:hypothetical protein BDV12DRAFT_205057, partial [Aspergillus spectabilis]
MLFGGFVCSSIADSHGRKIGLAVGIVIATGGICGELFSTSRPAFSISKLILGIVVGFYLTLGPVACSKFAPLVLREFSTSGVNLGIEIGGLLSKTARLPDPFRAGGSSTQDPVNALRLRDRSRQENRSISATIQAEAQQEQPSYISAFKGTDCIRTLISMGLFVAQQAVGIVFVFTFAPYSFQLAGLSTADSLNFGVGISACGVVGNVSACLLLIRFVAASCLSVVWAAARSSSSFSDSLTSPAHRLGIGDKVPCDDLRLCMLYLPWGDFIRPSRRSLFACTEGLNRSSSYCHQDVLGIVFQIAVPYLVNPDAANLKAKVGLVLGGTSLIATILAFWYIPELKGRTYAKIDQIFIAR